MLHATKQTYEVVFLNDRNLFHQSSVISGSVHIATIYNTIELSEVERKVYTMYFASLKYTMQYQLSN